MGRKKVRDSSPEPATDDEDTDEEMEDEDNDLSLQYDDPEYDFMMKFRADFDTIQSGGTFYSHKSMDETCESWVERRRTWHSWPSLITTRCDFYRNSLRQIASW